MFRRVTACAALRAAPRPALVHGPCVAARSLHHTPIRMGVDVVTKVQGSGAKPQKGQKVTVHCTGYLQEGRKKFWSTKDTNEPFSFNIGIQQVIKGWDEGVAQMVVGETAELTASGDYAYGPRGFPAWGIGPNATLIFEIELLSVQ